MKNKKHDNVIGWVEDIKPSKIIIAADINYNRFYFSVDKNMFIKQDQFSIQLGNYVERLNNGKYRIYLDPRPVHVRRREFNKAMEKANQIYNWLKDKK